MSTPSATAQAVYDLVNFYTVLMGWAITFYDHSIQLDREVDLVWSRIFNTRFSVSTSLYLLARFTLPFAYLLNLNEDLKALQSPSLRDLKISVEWVEIFSQCVIAVIMGLRTYAIWDRNRLVLLVLVCVGSTVPGIGIFLGVSIANGSHSQQFTNAVSFRSMLLSLMSLIFDFAVICLTIGRSVQLKRVHRYTPGGVLDTILRDGSIYFIALAATHLLNVLTFWFAPEALVGLAIAPSRSIAVVLATRLMLNLREMYYHNRARTDMSGDVHRAYPHPRALTSGVHMGQDLVHLPPDLSDSFHFSHSLQEFRSVDDPKKYEVTRDQSV